MDERVKEILGTDIDEVVAQGEKSGSKRKIAVVIIVFVALVVGVLGYFINRDAKYKDALHKENMEREKVTPEFTFWYRKTF